MTSLTVYFTETAATTVTTADTILANASTGGTLSNKNTNLTSGTTGWIEVWSQGNASAQTGAGAQPSPTGHGWLLDSTLLEANTLSAGTYTVSHPYETTTSGTFTADFHYGFYQRSSGGSYILIGEAIASTQTITSGSFTTITATGSLSASNQFAVGDKLYIHVTANISVNGTTGNLRMQASTSSTLGNTSAQVVTPGYTSVTTSTRTIPTSAVLQSTLTRTIPMSAVLSRSRTIPTSAVLTGPRTIPTSAVLQSTLTRTIPMSSSLTFTYTRSIPTSAALYTPSTFYASNVGFSVLADRPKAYYRLDELNGAIAFDSSGNGYDATLSGSITYNQPGAGAASIASMLFGSTATLSLPYTLNPSTWTSLSLEFWIKLTSGWQYVAVTTDNSTGTTILYLNGSAYSGGSGDFVGIDVDIYYAGSPLSGDLDEVAIYDYVLTPAQIANHYQDVSSIVVEPSLPYACELSETLGGTETSTSVTMPASGTNTYVELMSRGGTSTGTLALPAPTGYGWFIELQGNTILAGDWWSIFTLAKSGTPKSGASLIIRWYRRTMDGTYYVIGTSTLSSQTFSTTKTSYRTPTVTVKFPWQFVRNEVLYVDAFIWNGSTSWSSDVFSVYVSNSATVGVANDGVTFAPQILQTTPGLTYLCGLPNFRINNALPISNQAFNLADALDQRSVLTLTGEDAPGTTITPRGTPVILSDSQQGLLFTGNVQSDEMSKVTVGTNTQIEHNHTDHDNHYWFDKNPNVTNYANWYAGDIVCDFLQKLAGEGVTGQFAIESDYTPTTFSQGTLTNTVATTTTSPFIYAPNTATPPTTTNTGDLELVRAGTQFLLTEQTTSDFSSGTLTNMTASSNTLKPTTQSAIRFIAQMPLNVAEQNTFSSYNSTGPTTNLEGVNNFCNAQIWSGSQVIGVNDTLNFDIWIASSSPAYMATVNLTMTGASYPFLSQFAIAIPDDTGALTGNTGLFDQNNVSFDLLQDLSSYAKDAWYTRSIPLSVVSGATVTSVNLQIQGSTAGTYTIYVKNIYLSSHSGAPFFSTTATSTQVSPPPITVGGGYLPFGIIDVVSVYQPALSTRISPAHSISGVGLIQNSTINWTASLPGAATSPTTLSDIIYPPGVPTPTSTSSQGAMNIYASYDGTTWLPCTSQGALPGLPPGANVSGLSLYLMEQFQAGDDPTALPELLQVQITINSAAAQTTTDVVAAYGNATEWNTGTYKGTTVNANGDLINGGTYAPNFTTFNWERFDLGTHVTLSSTSSTLTIADSADTATSNSVLLLTDVLPLTNGTIECDLNTNTSGTNQWCRTGIMYRASNWSAGYNSAGTDDTQAYDPPMSGYLVMIQHDTTGTSHWLALVALSVTGSPTLLARDNVTVNSNTNYHVKIVFNNFRHTIYFNGATSPTIDIIDQTYLGAGNIGLYAMGTIGGSATVGFTSKWTTFTCTPLATGTWTSASLSLSSLGTCGYTQINWSEIATNGNVQSTAVVFTSLNGGSTWQQCANGAEVPLLTPGTSVSGKSLLIRIILYSNAGITSPTLIGLYARVCGNYGTVTGTRISPFVNLSPATYISSSNVMYNANTPTNTSVAVSTSINAGSSWEAVPNGGAGASLGYWTPQPSPTQDLFSVNTFTNYTNISRTGGSAASVLYTTAQSQLSLSGGSSGLYLSNAPTSVGDIEVACCLQQSDSGGLVWHYIDGSNYYELVVYDDSSSGGSLNALQLYKISSNVRTLLGAASMTFTRGSFHLTKIVMEGKLINAYWDGQCILSYLDTSPLGSGLAGLRNSGGISLYYQLYIQPLGVNLSGVGLQTKVVLTTSDPTYMPQMFVLACAVRGPHIAQGSQISQMHPLTVPFASYYSTEMDQLVQADGDSFWYVDKYGECYFSSRYARLGAFPLQTITDPANASGSLLYTPIVKVTAASDTFRNQQVVTNVTTLVTPPIEFKVADGTSTSWTLGYPVYSAPIILFSNGQPATVGVQGIDNDRQFYWQPNSPTLSYDSSLPVLPAGTVFSVQYVGQSIDNLIVNNTSSQATQAYLEGNSGIVCEIESALRATTIGMTTSQATTFANGLLSRNGISAAVEVMGTIMYAGLAPGTFIPVFAPEFGVWNVQLPIIKVTTTALPAATGLPVYQYLIDATNGANISNWQRVFGIA